MYFIFYNGFLFSIAFNIAFNLMPFRVASATRDYCALLAFSGPVI